MRRIAQDTGQSLAEVIGGQPPSPHGFSPGQMFGTPPPPPAEGEDEPDDFQHPQSPGPNLGPTLTPFQSPEQTMFADPQYDIAGSLAAQASQTQIRDLEQQLQEARKKLTAQAHQSTIEAEQMEKKHNVEKVALQRHLNDASDFLAAAKEREEAASKALADAVKAAKQEAQSSLSDATAKALQDLRIEKNKTEKARKEAEQEYVFQREDIKQKRLKLFLENEQIQKAYAEIEAQVTSNEEATRILEQQQYWLNTQASAQMSKSLGIQSSGSMGQQSNY